jgi:hypothetical protein
MTVDMAQNMAFDDVVFAVKGSNGAAGAKLNCQQR